MSRMDLGNENSGITIEYVKSRKVLLISGHYDHFVGIQGIEIPFDDFCAQLGIKLNRKKKPSDL